MSEVVINQFKSIRNWSIKLAEEISEEEANIQPEGFKNTIKWQLGHLITEAEYFLFEITNQPVMMPSEYNDWFGPGTRPSEWIGNVPKLSEMIYTMRTQLKRVSELPRDVFDQPLDNNIHNFRTVLEAAAFCGIHEAIHVGQLQSMKRILKVSVK